MIFFFLSVIWREVRKRLLPVRARHKRGTPLESPNASSLVAAMSVEELRSFCQVPADISLEFSDGATFSTVGRADNAFYFTQEQFVAGLCFPISSLVKQFLHFIVAPPTLIHPNVFRILVGAMC